MIKIKGLKHAELIQVTFDPIMTHGNGGGVF